MIHRLPLAAGLCLAALPTFAELPAAADPERPVPVFSFAPALADYRRFEETSLEWAAAHAHLAPPAASEKVTAPVPARLDGPAKPPGGAHPHHSHH